MLRCSTASVVKYAPECLPIFSVPSPSNPLLFYGSRSSLHGALRAACRSTNLREQDPHLDAEPSASVKSQRISSGYRLYSVDASATVPLSAIPTISFDTDHYSATVFAKREIRELPIPNLLRR